MSSVFAAIGTGIAAMATGGASLFASAAAGGATAAAGTTAAAATTATAATAGGGLFTTLSQVLSAGSALAAIGQGMSAKYQAEAQASFAQAEAAQEEAAGAGRARDLAREYAELRSEQTVIQLGNGLDIGVGTPVNVGEATKKQAERNLSVTRENTKNRAALSRLRSRGLMSEGRSSMLAGFGKAASIGLDSLQLTG